MEILRKRVFSTVMKICRRFGASAVVMMFALMCFYSLYRQMQTSFDTDTSEKEMLMEKMKTRKQMWDSVVERQKDRRTHRVPDVIVIGVRKCGTGSLRNYMYNHPLVRVNLQEMHYYDEKLENGLQYYIENLENATKEEVVMEKTPAYFVSLPHELPRIIHRDSPNVKLILMLCDPVNRAFSDYVMRFEGLSTKVLGKNFERYMEDYFDPVKVLFDNMTLDDDEEKFTNVMKFLNSQRPLHSFAVGIYAFFLRRWMREFPPSNLLLINGEEFLRDPGSVTEKIQDFIGIPKLLKSEDFVKNPETGLFCMRRWWEFNYESKTNWPSSKDWMGNIDCAAENKGRTRSKNSVYNLPSKCAEKLRKFYAPYNSLLSKMIKANFNWTT